jgi:hypothetical protein
MAISVNPLTFVINVPKADLTLVQLLPTEIYNMDLNWFRLELKSWEDEGNGLEGGITFLKTHTHNTEVSLGGLTFARVIEILAPYTITFEDGQYAVNLIGANSNVSDRVNVNQVSVRSQNSAGLISSPAIEFASFNGGVLVDTIRGVTGTIFPRGTEQLPVNNLVDALLIAEYRGFKKLYINESMELDGGSDLSEFTIVGQSHVLTELEIAEDADVIGVTFMNASIFGTLDGGNSIDDCVVGDITFFNGHIHNSSLYGTITLGGGEDAYIVNCSRLDISFIPVINMGGSGQDLVMPNYAGAIWIENLTGASKAGIGLISGTVILDSATVTSGNITVSGIGRLVDESNNYIETGIWNGGVTITNNLISKETISTAVWDEPLILHQDVGSTGEALGDAAIGGAPTAGEVADAVWDEDLTTHTTANSAGKILQDTKRDVGDAQALILAI